MLTPRSLVCASLSRPCSWPNRFLYYSSCAVESGQDIGSAAWLEQHYEQPQRRRNGAMVAAIDGMSSMFGPQVRGTLPLGWWVQCLVLLVLLLVPGAAGCALSSSTCVFLWCCLMQAGPVAGMRSLGLGIVNSSPALKHTILRIAMHGL